MGGIIERIKDFIDPQPKRIFVVGKELVTLGFFETSHYWNNNAGLGKNRHWEISPFRPSDKKKIRRLGLTQEQKDQLDIRYFNWLIEDGCRICPLKAQRSCNGYEFKQAVNPVIISAKINRELTGKFPDRVGKIFRAFGARCIRG